MLPDKYFKTHNVIYGDRCRFNGVGKGWTHQFQRFTSLDKALKWKAEGKNDFGWKRELLSRNECKNRGAKFDDKGRFV